MQRNGIEYLETINMSCKLSINTDFESDRGNPFPSLEKIAEAGFTHVHWGHHWNSDFIYTDSELLEISRVLSSLGLLLSDTHASKGLEKCWFSPLEYERIAGVELLKNRIYMTSLLGGDAVVLHPFVVYDKNVLHFYREQGLKSLREIESFARNCGIKIALENLFKADEFDIFDRELENLDTLNFFFREFSPDILGFCWDIGHCLLLGENAFKRCSGFARERLSVMHLSDNRGDLDQHSAPFTWSDRWDWIAEIIAASPYPEEKPVLLEVDINRNPSKIDDFLSNVYNAGVTFNSLLEKHRDNLR